MAEVAPAAWWAADLSRDDAWFPGPYPRSIKSSSRLL